MPTADFQSPNASVEADRPDPGRSARLPSSDTHSGWDRGTTLSWFAVLVWSGVIWHLGGENFSAPETRSILLDLLAWFGINLKAQTEFQLLTVLRKAAHVFEYGVLALLVANAAVRGKTRREIRGENRAARAETTGFLSLGVASRSLAMVLALAIADETRQAYSVSRTGSPYDVVLDFSGGLIALAALEFGVRIVRKRAKSSSD